MLDMRWYAVQIMVESICFQCKYWPHMLEHIYDICVCVPTFKKISAHTYTQINVHIYLHMAGAAVCIQYNMICYVHDGVYVCL